MTYLSWRGIYSHTSKHIVDQYMCWSRSEIERYILIKLSLATNNMAVEQSGLYLKPSRMHV